MYVLQVPSRGIRYYYTIHVHTDRRRIALPIIHVDHLWIMDLGNAIQIPPSAFRDTHPVM